MDKQSIIRKVDHTLLAQDASLQDIRQCCEDAAAFDAASVCIAPAFVKQAAQYLRQRRPLCTVVGFPLGYSTTAAKEYETRDALFNGADEIDMVINVGWVKDGRLDLVQQEISRLKNICKNRILKVIVETCLLTDEEKIRLCGTVTAAGADFIKTSTGFSKAGARFDDVALFAKHVGKGVRIKAAGGISTFEDAQTFISLGASRIGASRLIPLLKNGG